MRDATRQPNQIGAKGALVIFAIYVCCAITIICAAYAARALAATFAIWGMKP